MNKSEFKSLVKQILMEEVEKRKLPTSPVPQDDGKGTYLRQGPAKYNSEQLRSELDTIVKSIDKNFNAIWDDHGDLTVDARGLLKVRITPKWDNYFDAEIIIKGQERVKLFGQSWEQMKKFIKENYSNLESTVVNVDNALKKVDTNREDQSPKPDKGIPQDDKPKVKSVSDTKNKDLTFNQPASDKKEDVEQTDVKKDVKKQSDFKEEPPVKLKKEKDDDTHVVKFPKKSLKN